MSEPFRPIGSITRGLLAEIAEHAIDYHEARGNQAEAEKIRQKYAAEVWKGAEQRDGLPDDAKDAWQLKRAAQRAWFDKPCSGTADCLTAVWDALVGSNPRLRVQQRPIE